MHEFEFIVTVKADSSQQAHDLVWEVLTTGIQESGLDRDIEEEDWLMLRSR